MKLIVGASLLLTGLALITARQIASVFAGYDDVFLQITTRALRLYSLSYFLAGVNIFTVNLFSALNDGRISGMLSALRMFVFQMIAIFLLPLLWGGDGIWLAMLVAETGAFIVSLLMLKKQNGIFHYL